MQTVTTNPASNKKNGTQRAKELRQSIDARLDTLARAVDQVRASEDFEQYLRVQARFHHYSWHNTMLIATQRPDASQVAGYKTWQSLGRQVRKGEKGITIFAPCKFKREKTNGDGESDTINGLYFRAIRVFDIAQTDGPDLPEVDVPTIDASADDLLASLRKVSADRGIAVEFKPALDSGAFGVSKGGSIEIDNSHTTGQQAKTLAHELAHEELHKTDRSGLTRSVAELEAESVAYVVCMHFGVDSEVRSSRYITLWDGDSKALKASLERIAKTARGIIDEVASLDTQKAVA